MNTWAEEFEAEIDDAVTVSDFYPQESAQTHDVSSGHGVPVAYGSGSSQNLEPPVVVDEEMAEYDDSVEVSDFYPQESAQTHDVSSGHSVPVAYGSGSSQNLEPPVVVDEEMATEYQKGRRGPVDASVVRRIFATKFSEKLSPIKWQVIGEQA